MKFSESTSASFFGVVARLTAVINFFIEKLYIVNVHFNESADFLYSNFMNQKQERKKNKNQKDCVRTSKKNIFLRFF